MAKEVYVPARYRREGLTLRNFACPRVKEDDRVVAKYPLKSDTKTKTKRRVKNAMARYKQPHTVKCRGGMKKICSAYRRERLTHTDAYKEECK